VKWYTTKDVAGLLGLSSRRIHAYARAGFLHPQRGPLNEYRFSFQDLVLLRTAAGLHEARVPARRIREALDRLRSELPRGRSLSELRIAAEGDRVVVVDGDARWNPVSGQYHLDFAVAELGETVAPLAPRATLEAHAAGADLDADDWFELGLDLEAYAPAEARRAYARAIELEPRHADAHVNLGRILHDAGDRAAAEAHYRQALDAGAHPTAAYNLGVVLEDQGRLDDAETAYRRTIDLDPDLADAHYNLAMLLERRGEREAAVRHMATCKRIIDGGRRRD
jgi:tetratricopeptide (TPR) repeat protein